MEDSNDILNEVTTGDYKYGFVTDIDTEVIHRGLDEETVRIISAKKNEPTIRISSNMPLRRRRKERRAWMRSNRN